MILFVRKVVFFVALACLALSFAPTPSYAADPSCARPHKVSVYKKKAKKRTAKSEKSAATIVKIAQEQLARLGYYVGKIDGKMGPRTRSAIKNFQREHGLKPNGVLDEKTRRALDDASRITLGSKGFETHDYVNPTDAEVNQDYESPLAEGTKAVSSRFARIDVTEVGGGGPMKSYIVRINGESILLADGQPSVISISKTYDLGDTDAIIFTTYNANNTLCMFKNYVLSLSNAGNKMLDIENCTREHKAQVNNGSLYISFPERDDDRLFGATWRLEGAALRRL